LLSVDIESILRFKQRRVTNYQYRCNGPDIWLNLAPDEDDLSRVTSLQLYLKDGKDCKHAAILLDSTANLVSLDIELGTDLNLLEELLRRTRLVNGPRRLKSLRMERIDFSDGIDTLEQLVEIETLQDLQLIYCSDCRFLLKDLTKLPLVLKAFRIHEYDMGAQDFQTESIEFLQSLASLNWVSLTLDSDFGFNGPYNLLDWSSLRACAPMLKYLRVKHVSIKPPFPCQRSASSFTLFCRLATNLEQLAISGMEVRPNDVEHASENTSYKGVFHLLVSHD
jgi:hypothetical protein